MKNLFTIPVCESLGPILHGCIWNMTKVREGVSSPIASGVAGMMFQSLQGLVPGLILSCSKGKLNLVHVWDPVHSFPYPESPANRRLFSDG